MREERNFNRARGNDLDDMLPSSPLAYTEYTETGDGVVWRIYTQKHLAWEQTILIRAPQTFVFPD